MPELIEVELYRQLADRVVGRRIAGVPAADPLGLRGGLDQAALHARLEDVSVIGTRRRGKLLLIDTDGPVIGLRFGMTGRLLVDGGAAIERLEYGGTANREEWDRFVLRFADGGDLRLRDPRRLGGLELDPDEARLGPDAATITAPALRAALAASIAPLKARLLDQARIAGLGNLLVDEVLWRAGLDPRQAAGALTSRRVAGLARRIVDTVAELTERGGSHTGDLQAARVRGGRCPRDGAALRRETVGGRTTYWCPRHQR